mgnify:CR=1 FL=1
MLLQKEINNLTFLPLFLLYTTTDNAINIKDKITNSPLFKQIKLKSCFISSEPRNKLCRIISVNIFVSPDNAVKEVSINHHTNCTKIAIGIDVKNCQREHS